MTLKLALVSLTLALAPAAGFAQCAYDHVKETASTCPLGQSWNADSQACEPTASS